MKVKSTSALDQWLQKAANDSQLPQNIQLLAHECVGQAIVDWNTLERVAEAVQVSHGDDRPLLHQLCRGGGLVLPPPTPRQTTGKSPELQAHLAKLRAKLEQDKYDAMVAEVTVEERAAVAASEGGFNTYKQQMSFGLHVIVMMFAFYLFGHLAGMALSPNKVYHPAIGLAFMIFAMILETVLFVIRTTIPPKLHIAAAKRGRKFRAEEAAAAVVAGGNAVVASATLTEEERNSLLSSLAEEIQTIGDKKTN
ncbi:hypothetical protein NADE_005804 [Nannochloris sp. 'desiccata']|nr:hypothetical protein NADE_005804 [Chlorella desiccata (nom. nud.)]